MVGTIKVLEMMSSVGIMKVLEMTSMLGSRKAVGTYWCGGDDEHGGLNNEGSGDHEHGGVNEGGGDKVLQMMGVVGMKAVGMVKCGRDG